MRFLGFSNVSFYVAIVTLVFAGIVLATAGVVFLQPDQAIACSAGQSILNDATKSPEPEPPAGTRSINPDTRGLSATCEKGKQYTIRFLTPDELKNQRTGRCIGPINEFGAEQPVALDIDWQDGVSTVQIQNGSQFLPEAKVVFPVDPKGQKTISIACREGSDLRKELEKNPFTNGSAREARNRGLDEEVDALVKAYESGNNGNIKAATSDLVNNGLANIYEGFKNPEPASAQQLRRDQTFVSALERIAKEEGVYDEKLSGNTKSNGEYLNEARQRIAQDLEKFNDPNSAARLKPPVRPEDAPPPPSRTEPPDGTKPGVSTFEKTPSLPPTTLEEARRKIDEANKAYEACWFSCGKEEAALVEAQGKYNQLYEKNSPTENKTSAISLAPTQADGDLSRLDTIADKNLDKFLEDANRKTSDDPIKKLREDYDKQVAKFRADLEAAIRRAGGVNTTPPPGSDLWRLLLGNNTNQNNACTEALYRACTTYPYNYQACNICSQRGGPGGQNQNPLQELIGNIGKLLGRNTTNPAINQAMCGQYPGMQFINNTCQCPTGTQWMSTNASPYGTTMPQPTPYPYGTTYPQQYPYTQPNPYANPYGAYPYPQQPTGSCQAVNVCAQYPGTQLINNQCTCPQGQQWTGTKCEVPPPAPQEQIKAELSCSSRIVDSGTPLSISWSCTGASTSRGDGFDTGGTTSGSKEISVSGVDTNGNPVPPFNLALTCTKEGRIAVAQCPLEVNRPVIVASAVLSIVTSGQTTKIVWIVKGMKEGDDVCKITSDKHPDFSVTGRNKVVETPPITELTKFKIRCTTRADNTKEAEIAITVK